MTRDEAIRHIQCLFPADSEYDDTAEIGQGLLARAKHECNNWRNEPDDVLIRYAELCIEAEQGGL